jgi:hypothetical protein
MVREKFVQSRHVRFFCSRFLIGSSKGHDPDFRVVIERIFLSPVKNTKNTQRIREVKGIIDDIIKTAVKSTCTNVCKFIEFLLSSIVICYQLLFTSNEKQCHFNILFSSSDIVMNSVFISTLKYVIKWNVMGSPECHFF